MPAESMVAKRYDVIVVGGGVTGTSIAFHLARADVSVRLLERVTKLDSSAGHRVLLAQTQMRVGLLTGCVQDQWFRQVNRDSVDALLHHGCEVVTPKRQGCCGALHAHQGDPEYGRILAGRLL